MDSNLDGKVDATDAGFSELRVGQDTNSDGLTEAGELHILGTSYTFAYLLWRRDVQSNLMRLSSSSS